MNYNAHIKDFNDEGYSAANTVVVTTGDHTLHVWFKDEEIGEIMHYYGAVNAEHETMIALVSVDGFLLDTGHKVVKLGALLDDLCMNYRSIYDEAKER